MQARQRGARAGARAVRVAPKKKDSVYRFLVRAEQGSENDGEAGADAQVPFGQRKGDVVLIGCGMLTLPFALHKALTFAGVDSLQAGNIVQATVISGILLTWTGTYVYRVLTQQMTYNKQLREYEEAVLRKRLEELPESELETLMEEVEAEKQAKSQTSSTASVDQHQTHE